MNTKTLAQQYSTLTPWERLPLTVAASLRGDTVEYERLVRSAPRLAFQVPDHYGLGEGLLLLAHQYLLSQLDLAATIWREAVCLAAADELAPDPSWVGRLGFGP